MRYGYSALRDDKFLQIFLILSTSSGSQWDFCVEVFRHFDLEWIVLSRTNFPELLFADDCTSSVSYSSINASTAVLIS